MFAARMFLLLQMPGNTNDWRYLLDQHGSPGSGDNPDLYQRLSVIACALPRFLTGRDTPLDGHAVAVLIILLE